MLYGRFLSSGDANVVGAKRLLPRLFLHVEILDAPAWRCDGVAVEIVFLASWTEAGVALGRVEMAGRWICWDK